MTNEKKMSAPLRVRVLLATYNGECWLRDQIDSVLGQSGVEVRISVSDDLSTDGTVAELLQLTELDDRIEIAALEKKHGSASKNFFSLLREADFSEDDYVALCDQDDVWDKEKLEMAITRLANSTAVGYSASVTAAWPSGRAKVLYQSARIREFDYLFEGAGQGCTYVLRASFAMRIQQYLREFPEYFEPLHYHDWAIYAVARSMGESWHFDDRSVLTYRQHDLNDTGARGSVRSNAKRLQLIRSGWYRQQVLAVSRLALRVNNEQQNVQRVLQLVENPSRSLLSNLCYAVLMARRSRRRLVDRLVLAVSALGGWL